MAPNIPGSRRLLLFAALLVSGLHLFLVYDGRTVREHETGTLYQLQRIFLGASSGGRPALWIPGLDCGTPTEGIALAQAGIVQSLLVPFAPSLEGSPFPPLFYLGLWVDEMLLLLGCWSLAARLYRSPRTVFFVALAAMGGALWADDAWLHLRSIYLIPLALASVHDFLRAGRPRSLALAAALLVVQAAGTSPSTRILPWALVVSYVAGASWVFHVQWGGAVRNAGVRRVLVALAVGIVLPALPLLVVSSGGGLEPAAPHVFYPGRLLEHSGLADPAPWIDLLTGVSPDVGATCYSGVLAPVLAAAALSQLPARLPWFVAGCIAGLAAVLEASFAIFPALRPDGPVPFLLPLVRMAMVFAAGAGFEAWAERRGPRLGPVVLALGACVFAAGLAFSVAPGAEASARQALIAALPEGRVSPVLADPRAVSELFGVTGMVALGMGAILLLGEKVPRAFPLSLGFLALFLHPVDTFGWKYRSTWIKTRSGKDSDPEAHRIRPPRFHPRRARWEDLRRGEPSVAGGRVRDHEWLRDLPPYGARRFPAGAGDRVEAAGGPPILGSRAAATVRRLRLAPDGVRKDLAEAVTADKLRWVASAVGAPDDQTEQRLLRGPEPPVVLRADSTVPSGAEGGLVSAITGFSAHHLACEVTAPPGGGWLFYSDAWDPRWGVEFDGRPAPVLLAEGGFKAVRVEEGRHGVEWRYRDPVRAASAALSGLGLVVVVLLGAWVRIRDLLR